MPIIDLIAAVCLASEPAAYNDEPLRLGRYPEAEIDDFG